MTVLISKMIRFSKYIFLDITTFTTLKIYVNIKNKVAIKTKYPQLFTRDINIM